jgi:DNA helicase-2/ATP-dependent DNA helicase PcrA
MSEKEKDKIDKSLDFEMGDQVRHPKWGIGTIMFKSGSGDKIKVIVLFPEEGRKTLMLKYAKLEKL